jgi:hypothetical protein
VAGLAGEGAEGEIVQYLDTYCKKLDGDLKIAACKVAVKLVMNKVVGGESPASACSSICNATDACNLFPEWPIKHLPPAPPAWPTQLTDSSSASDDVAAKVTAKLGEYLDRIRAGGPLASFDAPASASAAAGYGKNPCGLNASCNIDRFTNGHFPLVDEDGDGFGESPNGTLRNWHWRGRDCAPDHDDRYPGRKTTDHPATVDHNCNGIAGENTTGSYEELFCSGSDQRGIVLLGDSATAHFHIPPQWMTANGWTAAQIASKEAALFAEDELDRPYCAWGTGFANASECPYPFGFTKVESLASRLRERNLCNHRDYQNIGVNGARINHLPTDLVGAMTRATALDHPALVFVSLIGNDVCNGHAGSGSMTKPAEFEYNARKALARLDTLLPAGSTVLAIGLVDGRVLWDTMHAQQHPLGPNYEAVYSFLSCNEANPCWGWLNSNETWRNFTTSRAEELNDVYAKIAAEQGPNATESKYDNFKFHYHAVDWPGYIRKYVESGGTATDLIEPVDGFHPSQVRRMAYTALAPRGVGLVLCPRLPPPRFTLSSFATSRRLLCAHPSPLSLPSAPLPRLATCTCRRRFGSGWRRTSPTRSAPSTRTMTKFARCLATRAASEQH